MPTDQELRNFNRTFGVEFGFNPHSEPFFRWMRTSDMFYFVDHGPGWTRSPAGLAVLDYKYERRCWADRLGVRWIIVKWKHWTEEEWKASFGTKMPYPKATAYWFIRKIESLG